MAAALAVESCWPQTMAREAGKAGLAPAQGEGAGLLGDRHKARIGGDQLREARLQVGFAVEEVGHGMDCHARNLFGCHRPPRLREGRLQRAIAGVSS